MQERILRPALQPNQSSLFSLHHSRDRGGERPNGQIVNIKRAADGRRQRSRKIIDERENYWAKNESSQNTSTNSKGVAFVILKNHVSAPIKKERLNPTSKARRNTSGNKNCGKGQGARHSRKLYKSPQ